MTTENGEQKFSEMSASETSANEAALQKQVDWQAEKLRNRFEAAMKGSRLAACVLALTDAYYDALSRASESPLEAGLSLLTMAHVNKQPAIVTPEPARIVVP